MLTCKHFEKVLREWSVKILIWTAKYFDTATAMFTISCLIYFAIEIIWYKYETRKKIENFDSNNTYHIFVN